MAITFMCGATSMYKLLKDEINWAEIFLWQLISTNYKLDYTTLSMLYALDHYHAKMSNFPGRLSPFLKCQRTEVPLP